MAKIHAFIKTDYVDKNSEAPLIIEYSHLKKRWRINTEIKVDPEFFSCDYAEDTELFKLSGNASMKREQRSKLGPFNTTLQAIQLKLTRIVGELKLKSASLSPATVKKEYEKDTPVQKETNKPVSSWYAEFIAVKEKEIGEGINSYRATFRHFKSFTEKKGSVLLEELTKAYLEDFKQYLIGIGLDAPTVHKQFKNLRIFLNWIQSHDDNDNQEIKIPSAYKKLKVKARYGDPIGLTVKQFFELYKLDLSAHKELERTRNLFVFGVSIGGPRHGDLKRLGESLRRFGFNLNSNSISFFEGKTGNAHNEIQVNRFGIEVLEKEKFIFPHVPSNQRMNQNLKSIAKKLDWDEIKFIPKYDVYGKLISTEEIPLKDIFSTKFMRKTAATIDNYLGIPTKTSMKRTGHKTFAAFSRYVDVNKESMTHANQKWDEMYASLSKVDG
ncbi:tyrosine-type recombinase/integrase [Chryseosolibacter indicus]|uniref:Phage integrase SAM-like domain-containing protein n=1 Tax=Chryseosolibacter indicus TaxID=2782351 RepID=A0ABS5VLG4_9BACT|nr:phage integrase SAM-like domain-containing protein [Chryseosolibacter indicus]MBT1702300.1 phage integrase SAM-like domain-containing protein [Chryseosolibacter indicus]